MRTEGGSARSGGTAAPSRLKGWLMGCAEINRGRGEDEGTVVFQASARAFLEEAVPAVPPHAPFPAGSAPLECPSAQGLSACGYRAGWGHELWGQDASLLQNPSFPLPVALTAWLPPPATPTGMRGMIFRRAEASPSRSGHLQGCRRGTALPPGAASAV